MGNDDINYQRDRNLTFDQIRQDMAQQPVPQVEFPLPTQQPPSPPLPQAQTGFVQSAVQQPNPQVMAQQQAQQAKEKQLIQMALSMKSPGGSQIVPTEAQQIEDANPADDIIPDVAQQPFEDITLYHGTTNPNYNYDFGRRKATGLFTDNTTPTTKSQAIFFAEDKKNAEFFGGWRSGGKDVHVFEASIKPEAKIADLTFRSSKWFESYNTLKSISKIHTSEYDNANMSIQQIIDDPSFVKQLKAKGYDGIRFVEPEGKGTSVAIVNKDVIKPKVMSSQTGDAGPLKQELSGYLDDITKIDLYDKPIAMDIAFAKRDGVPVQKFLNHKIQRKLNDIGFLLEEDTSLAKDINKLPTGYRDEAVRYLESNFNFLKGKFSSPQQPKKK